MMVMSFDEMLPLIFIGLMGVSLLVYESWPRKFGQ
ncbi:hypothetical protein ACVIWV_004093 [Bradyrhizobium diazoefficiens]|uniref:Uncharacterized protein n=1 Tax=Bradyrhizobium diazoefficiens TaxID=1355477 RepID=A0A0E4G0P9_9BRAD|nr:hypothetical protein NK6_7811 [Bradyrhizobium diazoefficiens]